MNAATAALARQLTGKRSWRIRQGTVSAVHTNRTIDVTIGASAATVTVPCLGSAMPRVGSGVMLLTDGLDLFALGSVADNSAIGYAPLQQFGKASISLSSSSTASVVVSFPWSFPDTPVVVGVCDRGAGNTANFLANVGSVSSSGFNARATTRDGTATSDTVTFYWSAYY